MCGHYRDSIAHVERLTDTQIVLTGGQRYRKQDGWRVGSRSGFYASYLMELTEEKVKAIQDKHLRQEATLYLQGIRWHHFTVEQLAQVMQLVKGMEEQNGKH